jgi:hypothetical protein
MEGRGSRRSEGSPAFGRLTLVGLLGIIPSLAGCGDDRSDATSKTSTGGTAATSASGGGGGANGGASASGGSSGNNGGGGSSATGGTGGSGGGMTRLSCPDTATPMDGVIRSAIAATGTSSVNDVDVLCDGSFAITGLAPGDPNTASFESVDGTPLVFSTESFTAAFDAEGRARWVKPQAPGATDGSGRPAYLSMFGDGSVLVGGLFGGEATFGIGESNEASFDAVFASPEGFLVRYQPNGALAWARHIGPPSHSFVVDVAAGSNGLSYAIVFAGEDGLVIGPGELDVNLDAGTGAVVALSVDGRYLHALRFSSSSVGSPRITTLADGNLLFALDSNEEVVLGLGTPAETRLAPAGVVYANLSPELAIDSVRNLGVPSTSYASAALPDGSVAFADVVVYSVTLAAGEANEISFTNANTNDDGFVAKYDPAGSLAWARQISGDDDVSLREVSGSADGSVWVLVRFGAAARPGEIQIGPGLPDGTAFQLDYGGYFVARFSAIGDPLWVRALPVMFSPGGLTAWPSGALVSGAYHGVVELGPPSGLTFPAPSSDTVFAALLGP